MRKLLFIGLIPLAIQGCTLQPKKEENVINQIDIPEVEYDYDQIHEFSLLWDDVFNVELDDYFVYYYSLTCSHCQELKNWIVPLALQRGDIFFVRSSNKDKLKNDVSSTIYAENAGDIAILGYPSCIQISYKKVVKNIAGITKIKALLSSRSQT